MPFVALFHLSRAKLDLYFSSYKLLSVRWEEENSFLCIEKYASLRLTVVAAYICTVCIMPLFKSTFKKVKKNWFTINISIFPSDSYPYGCPGSPQKDRKERKPSGIPVRIRCQHVWIIILTKKEVPWLRFICLEFAGSVEEWS